MPFLLVNWPFSAKHKVIQSCIQSKFKNSVQSFVHFLTKSIQYECKLHIKTIFFTFETFGQISKPPPSLHLVTMCLSHNTFPQTRLPSHVEFSNEILNLDHCGECHKQNLNLVMTILSAKANSFQISELISQFQFNVRWVV